MIAGRFRQHMVANDLKSSPRREKLFVIIGTYNHERFISQAMEGALAQEVDLSFQILIRDDASTDNTSDIIRRYAARHPGKIVPILNEVNQYASGTGWTDALLHRVSKIARFVSREKVYVALCEGDDFWTDSKKLQIQVDFLREHRTAALVHHGFNVVTEEGNNSEYEAKLRNHLARFEPQPRLRDGLDLLEGNFIMTCTMMMRLSGWNPRERKRRPKGLLADWVNCFVASRQRQVGFIGKEMSIYRVHGGGIHSSRSLESNLEISERTARHLMQLSK